MAEYPQGPPSMLGGSTQGKRIGGVDPIARTAKSDRFKNGVGVADYGGIGEQAASGNMQQAMMNAHRVTPGMSNEDAFNYVVAPGMLMGHYGRNYEPLRQQMMNPYRNMASNAANAFSRNYSGMKGGPEMQGYIMSQAPFMNAMSDVNARVGQMRFDNEDEQLAALINLQRANSNRNDTFELDTKRRDAEAKQAEQAMWGQIASLGGQAAGAVVGAM